MYVYNKLDRPKYAALTQFRRAWLDYWLYLHGNESSACLAARPISPWFMAKKIVDASPSIDKDFLKATNSIVKRLLLSSQKSFPPAPSAEIIQKNSVADSWKMWASQVCATSPTAYREELLEMLAQAEEQDAFATAAFASRRLASEFAAEDWSSGSLFSVAKQAILDEGKAPAEVLRTVIDEAGQCHDFMVEFDLVPADVSNEVLRRRLPESLRFVTSKRSDWELHRPSNRLTGLRCTVTAPNISQAVAKSVEIVSRTIRNLRINDYVRTHLIAARVTEENRRQTFVSLPQPFWTPGPARRPVPTLPAERLEATGVVWKAALGHLSTALAIWIEAPHSAASSIWQALECLGYKEQAKHGVQKDLVNQIATRELEHLATKFSSFCEAMKGHLNVDNWYYWTRRCDARKWAGRVFDARSKYHVGTWGPDVPLAMFDFSNGVAACLWHAAAGLNDWFEKRLHEDLQLLSSVRNSLVHEGSQLGNRRLAEHLAKVGLDCLVSRAIRDRAKQLRQVGSCAA